MILNNLFQYGLQVAMEKYGCSNVSVAVIMLLLNTL
jgi:hypothetical protein